MSCGFMQLVRNLTGGGRQSKERVGAEKGGGREAAIGANNSGARSERRGTEISTWRRLDRFMMRKVRAAADLIFDTRSNEQVASDGFMMRKVRAAADLMFGIRASESKAPAENKVVSCEEGEAGVPEASQKPPDGSSDQEKLEKALDSAEAAEAALKESCSPQGSNPQGNGVPPLQALNSNDGNLPRLVVQAPESKNPAVKEAISDSPKQVKRDLPREIEKEPATGSEIVDKLKTMMEERLAANPSDWFFEVGKKGREYAERRAAISKPDLLEKPELLTRYRNALIVRALAQLTETDRAELISLLKPDECEALEHALPTSEKWTKSQVKRSFMLSLNAVKSKEDEAKLEAIRKEKEAVRKREETVRIYSQKFINEMTESLDGIASNSVQSNNALQASAEMNDARRVRLERWFLSTTPHVKHHVETLVGEIQFAYEDKQDLYGNSLIVRALHAVDQKERQILLSKLDLSQLEELRKSLDLIEDDRIKEVFSKELDQRISSGNAM